MSKLEEAHTELVKALVKPPAAIIAELTEQKADLLHAAVGIAGEAGELLDAIKKHVIYDKPLDMLNVIEELGDLEFYMKQLRLQLDIRRQMCLSHNVSKLRKRYGATYSNEAAQARADKQ
jgi:NTP pyrophosphatase (non-canonical NTP hydrolase)